jgi:hypothetical protein
MKPKRPARRPRSAFPPSDQIVWLRGEVLRLREQASAWRELYCDRDRELERVEARAERETRALRERNACQAQRLRAAVSELVETQARLQGLAALCDALLDATESAFGSEPAAPGSTELPRHAQGSA